jgi:hypothetical protein
MIGKIGNLKKIDRNFGCSLSYKYSGNIYYFVGLIKQNNS